MKHLLCLLLVLAGNANALLPDESLSAADKVRFHRLCQNLIAPCCWSQPVDVHISPAADEARAEVAAMITQGKSDRQILDSFIMRYGERILAEPEGFKSVILTALPIVTLMCGLVGLGGFLLRRRQRSAVALPPGTVDFFQDSEWE